MKVIHLGNDHVFAYLRTGSHGDRVLVIANFTEHTQPIPANEVRLYGAGYHFRDLISGQELTLAAETVVLAPYQVLWLVD
jgi:amylosucrase